MYIGECFVGDGVNAAHINVVTGPKDGPAGLIFGQALANPKVGHVPFLSVVRPSIPVKPFTVFVNKADIQGETHGDATWGAAQAGVSAGVHAALDEGLIPAEAFDEWVVTACVWVNWGADDLDEVFENNRHATREAMRAAYAGEPTRATVDEAALAPANPFYTAPVAVR